MIYGGDHRDGGEACKLESVKSGDACQSAATGFLRPIVKTLTCALRQVRYSRCRRLAQPVRMSHEDAAVGLLVVQGRRFWTIPGKVPQAAAPLTGI
jgi:hypothetical protein